MSTSKILQQKVGCGRLNNIMYKIIYLTNLCNSLLSQKKKNSCSLTSTGGCIYTVLLIFIYFQYFTVNCIISCVYIYITYRYIHTYITYSYKVLFPAVNILILKCHFVVYFIWMALSFRKVQKSSYFFAFLLLLLFQFYLTPENKDIPLHTNTFLITNKK